MDAVLYLTHRIPWPPNKGDKIRSHHILRQLSRDYRVHLGTFIDDPADSVHLPALAELCDSVYALPLHPRWARLRALSGLLWGEALTLPYYRVAAMRDWVRRTVAEQRISEAVVFSCAMAQYVNPLPGLRRIVDLVDVDSDKWRQYAQGQGWPWRYLYAREARRLLAFERHTAQAADACLLVSADEAALFRRLAPESAARVHVVHNGVDTAYFDPAADLPNPYPPGVRPLVFTGAMDYWPNEDAVRWFAQAVLPGVVAQLPEAVFYIVGHRPGAAVRALTQHPRVRVTGSVADVRPYLAHAAAVVAPLRIARGVQNKVLEAMAMGRAVIATRPALEGIRAEPGRELLLAETSADFQRQLLALTPQRAAALGQAARRRVLADYAWGRNLQALRTLLSGGCPPPTGSAYLAEHGGVS